jgi:hypothetical protein
MQGIERERDCGNGADGRDVIVRTVLFACASLAAWWCCSNVASADEAQPVEHRTDHADHAAPEASAPVEPEPAAPVAPTAPGTAVDAAEPAGAAPADQGPVLFPVVVAPLVEAVSPAVAPSGNAVLPMVDAVTAPAAPVLQSVMPVADRIVGPVVGPVAGPAVEVVKPVVEQVAVSAAPFVELVAPVVVPVTGVVAPVVGGVVSSVADPVAGAAEPALRSVLDVDPRYFGLRPATADFPIDLDPVGDVFEVAGPLALVPLTFEPPVPTGRSSAAGDDADGTAGPDGGAVPATPALAAAPVAAPVPVGGPFRGGYPSSRAVVVSQGQPDSGQRSQRLVAVLPGSAGTPGVPTAALGGVLVESPLARFGGRPPVTPD